MIVTYVYSSQRAYNTFLTEVYKKIRLSIPIYIIILKGRCRKIYDNGRTAGCGRIQAEEESWKEATHKAGSFDVENSTLRQTRSGKGAEVNKTT